MKNKALFSSKNKRKKLKCCLLQFLFGTLRVNYRVSPKFKICWRQKNQHIKFLEKIVSVVFCVSSLAKYDFTSLGNLFIEYLCYLYFCFYVCRYFVNNL